MGKQREMVRGVTSFSLRVNNFRVLDPGRRGNKDVVQLEPEKKSAKSVIGGDISTIGISCPKGVYQRFGIEYIPFSSDF